MSDANALEPAKDRREKREHIIAWIALFVALFGGVPGVFAIRDALNRRAATLGFHPEQTFFAGIRSKEPGWSNRLALVMYQVNITGAGLQPIYVQNVRVEAKINNEWRTGEAYFPQTYLTTNQYHPAGTPTVLVMVAGVAHANLMDWRSMPHGAGRALQYGEPLDFSYVCAFDLNYWDFESCNDLKITVVDTFGKEYPKRLRIDPNRDHARTTLLYGDGKEL